MRKFLAGFFSCLAFLGYVGIADAILKGSGGAVTNGGTVNSAQLLAPDGVACTSPAYSFTSAATTGFANAATAIDVCQGGTLRWMFDTSGNLTAQGNQSISTGGAQSGVNAGRFNATTGSTPTIGGAACGTTPSISGKDSAMKITVGSGGAATTCAVSFGATWTNPPTCIAQNDTDRVSYSMVTTATALTITATAAITAASKFHVICMGQ